MEDVKKLKKCDKSDCCPLGKTGKQNHTLHYNLGILWHKTKSSDLRFDNSGGHSVNSSTTELWLRLNSDTHSRMDDKEHFKNIIVNGFQVG